MKLFKKIISDVSYVSKLTGTHNKKLIIAKAVIFSQICAFFDILIILLFAAILTGSYNLDNVLSKISCLEKLY